MKLKKTKLLSPVVALLLCTNVYAQNSYSIQNKSLKQAIETISKKANIPYIVSGNLLAGKNSKNISNVKGTQNALNEILRGSGLTATIEDGAIIIKKITRKISSQNNSNTQSVGSYDVIAQSSNITEGTGSYTVDNSNSATRMNLSLKETPQSITVITKEKMDDLALESVEDLVAITNGLHVNTFDSERMYFLSRGFSIENFQVDGISTNIASGGYSNYQDLGMYDRVDVIRGATGLLSGSGEPSAAINFVRKKAKSKDFKGKVSVEAGSWKKKKATIDLSSGLNEDGSIRARVFISKLNKESHLNFYERDENVIFATVEADLSDDTLITAGASYQNFDAKGSSYGSLPAFFEDGSETNFDRKTTIGAPWTGRDTKQKRIFTNLEHNFDNTKVVASYSYGETKEQNDLAWVFGAPNKQSGLGLKTWQSGTYEDLIKHNSFDLYSSSTYELFGEAHELIAGLSLSKKNISYQGTTYENEQAILGDLYKQEGFTGPGKITLDPKKENTVKENAIYIANKFSFGEDLKVILGARLSNYKLQGDEIWGDNKIYNEHKNNFTPYMGLIYDLDASHSVYASYTDIFKVQEEKDKYNKHLDPKVGESFETGIKASYFENKINASASIFRTLQDNVAVDDGMMIDFPEEYASKGAKGVTSKGFEAEIAGEINDNLNVSFGFSSFKAKDKDGIKLKTQTPRKKIKMHAKYTFDKLALGGGLNWQSDMYFDYKEDGFSKRTQKALVLVNAMAKYDFSKDLSLQINVNNIFDKTYYSSIDMYGVNYGTPRSANVKLNYKF